MLCSFYFSNSINNINVSACVRDDKKETLKIYLIGSIQNPPRRNICFFYIYNKTTKVNILSLFPKKKKKNGPTLEFCLRQWYK